MLIRRALGALALLGLSLATVPPTTAVTRAAVQRPNIVVIITDDMRYDQLHVMKNVLAQLAGHGRSFNDFFATGVICCPSRTSFLRGQYVHTHSVYQTHDATDDPNDPFARYSGGAWAKAVGVDQPTVANWLQDLGYYTAESGKFLNSYPGLQPPSGWNFWRQKTGGYTNFKVVVNGQYVQYGRKDYEADVVTNHAIDGIHAAGSNPLFLWLAYFAPHEPWTPPARYNSNTKAPQCAKEKITGLPSFNEASRDKVDAMNDKPAWETRTPHTATEAKALGVTRIVNGCRTLLAVDDNIKRVIAALNAKDPGLDNTIIVFTSDQGVEDGQHMQPDKEVPYEETIHLPFIVRADGLLGGTKSVDTTHLLTNIDLAPTLVQLAGGDPSAIHPGCPNSDDKFEAACVARGGGFDGYSFAPLLTGQGAYAQRSDFLIEHWSPLATTEIGEDPPAFCAVRTKGAKLIRYWRGPDLGVDWEGYDLTTDPHELHSLVHTGSDGGPAFRGEGQGIYDTLYPRLVTLCDPTPPEYPPFS
jgi:N-acetylglucosamine-6-sulfatase